MPVIPLLLILAAAAAAPAPRPTPLKAHVVAVHDLFASEVGAVVWLERTERKYMLRNATLIPEPVRFWRYPEPIADGTWIQLLDRQMRPLGVYAAALPDAGQTCGIEVPMIKGLWYLVLLQQEGSQRRLVGHVEVGPRLASLARRERVWKLLGLPTPPPEADRPAPAPTPHPEGDGDGRS